MYIYHVFWMHLTSCLAVACVVMLIAACLKSAVASAVRHTFMPGSRNIELSVHNHVVFVRF